MITIGHDAELFGVDSEGNVVSLIGKVGGTKEEPSPCDQGALQEDNVMAELNIDPAHNRAEFVNRTTKVMEELEGRLAKYKLKPLIIPHATLSADELNHPKAQESGCSPDYDAWRHCENEPVNLTGSMERYAGGHIHFGVPFKDNPAKITTFIRYLDATLGAGSLVKFGLSKRLKAYGRWGAHRPTPYGVEYRFLDNTWLQSIDDMRWVYNVGYWVATRINSLPQHEPATNIEELEDVLARQDIEELRSIYNNHVTEEYRL